MRLAKVTAGFVIVAALFSFVSCINIDNTLGKDLIPSDQYLDIQIETFDLPVELASADSLQSSYFSSMRLGNVVTEEFGSFNADMAVSFTPSTDSIVWGKDPKFIDMTAYLTVESSFCPSEDQKFIPQTIHFYQLAVELDSTMTYSGSITDKDYIHTPIEAHSVTYTGDGTINVSFKEEFGKRLFDFTMEQLDSTKYFMKHFFGMYITSDPLEEGTLGGRLNSVDLSSAYVYLNYSFTDDDGMRKSASVSFKLGTEFSVGVYRTSSKHMETADPKDRIYCEGLTGIKPVIRGAALKSAMDKWIEQMGMDRSRLLINRASIDFPFDYNGDRNSLDSYPMTLFPCRRVRNSTANYVIFYEPIAEIQESLFEQGGMNRSLMLYRSDIGLQLQSLIKKDKSEVDFSDDLWMMPVTIYSDESTGETYYLADTESYYTGTLNGTSSNRRPQMTVTYTYIK